VCPTFTKGGPSCLSFGGIALSVALGFFH
jgi:hypothetical protein